jgi:transcriptional regulator with XRE-family HTH domain
VFGLETEQKEIQAIETKTVQQEAPRPDQRVGALLKRERERLGLSREQITEMTRIRPLVVEAIENEAWGSLPPAVFVRGFLRSYAKVLGVSQDTVIDLYAKSAPPESPGLMPYPEPSKSRGRTVRLVFLILVILAGAYGMWSFYPSLQVRQGSRDTEKKDHEAAPPPSQPAVVQNPQPVLPAESPTKKGPGPLQSLSRETLSGLQGGESPARDPIQNEEGWLSLTGIVKERTWLRIKIDGKEEKEYLFHPGSRPQWRGKESFYMLIGNAAGIDFELNGKKVGNLGNPGQVIRLTLPKDVGQREGDN